MTGGENGEGIHIRYLCMVATEDLASGPWFDSHFRPFFGDAM
jgi:hypothetical protein